MMTNVDGVSVMPSRLYRDISKLMQVFRMRIKVSNF